MASNDIGDWYKSIPFLTKCWFTGSIIVPLLGRFGLVRPMWMFLHFQSVFYDFQIWRPISATLFYPITPSTGFSYLLNLYFLYAYSTQLETGVFDGKPAEYAFMLLFNWLCLVIIGFIGGIYLLMDMYILSALYVWCQLNRETIVNFWFGTRFKAMYLPWVLLGFNMILRGGGLSEILGILVGHLYFFLMFKYPQDFGGVQLLYVPQFLYRLLPSRQGGVSGFGAPPGRETRRTNASGTRHNWGQGATLGGQ